MRPDQPENRPNVRRWRWLLSAIQARILTLFILDASHEFRTPVTVIKTTIYRRLSVQHSTTSPISGVAAAD